MKRTVSTIVEGLVSILQEAKRKKRKRRRKVPSSLLYYMDYTVNTGESGEGAEG